MPRLGAGRTPMALGSIALGSQAPGSMGGIRGRGEEPPPAASGMQPIETSEQAGLDALVWATSSPRWR